MLENRFQLMSEAITKYTETPGPGTVAGILNPYQLGVTRAVGESWMTYQKGRVKAPTGAGKTVMQAAVIEGTRSIDPEAKTLVVVPRIQLLNQTTNEFKARIPDITLTPYYGYEKDLSGEVNITTYLSLIRGVTRGDINPELYKLVLFDEAHHLLPKARVKASEKFVDSLQVGFTATPAYGKNRHLKEVLTNEISSTSIRELVEANLLCSFSVYMLQTGISLDDVKVKGKEGESEFDDVALQKAVNVATRNQAAVDLYKTSFLNKQTISYCAGVDHARALADLFNYNGIKAAAVSGYQTPKIQSYIIDRYRRGEIQVICNADLLIEGFDDIKTSVVLNLRPTLSPRLAEQRGGRTLRLDREDRSKYAYIIDFIDEVKGKNQPVSFAQVAEAAQIVNTWYEHKGGEYKGYLKPVILDLKGAKFITDSKEVMWAVNELSGTDYEIEEGWKTLRRISAETGVPLDILTTLVEGQYPGAFSDLIEDEGEKYVKDFISPKGNRIKHFYYNAAFSLFNEVLSCMGYKNNESSTEELTKDNLYIFDPTAYQTLNDLGKRFAKRLRNVDVEVVKEYVFHLYEKIMEDEEKIIKSIREQKTVKDDE